MAADPTGFDQPIEATIQPPRVTAVVRYTAEPPAPGFPSPQILALEVEGDAETVCRIVTATADAVENEVLR